MAEDTVFTKIIKRELPATVRYEDEGFIAFDDINPKAPVHVLVVPKKQIPTLEDVSSDDTQFLGELLNTARKVAKITGISENYKLFFNVGLKVQMVPHIHVHILGGWKKASLETEIHL